MKLRHKIILLLLTLSLVPLLLTSFIYYQKTKDAITNQVLDHVSSLSETHKNRILSFIDRSKERVSFITNKTTLKENLKKFETTGDIWYQQEMNDILADTRPPLTSFQCVNILNKNGIIIASTDSSKIGEDKSKERFFKRGSTGISIDNFYLEKDHGLSDFLSGPMLLNNELVGVAVIITDAKELVRSINDFTGLGRTGETVLAMLNENGDALFITDVRKDPDAALKRVIPKERQKPINMAVKGVEITWKDQTDYANDKVLASSKFIEETNWGIVSQIDKDEALAPLHRLRNMTIGLNIMAIIMVALSGFYFSKRLVEPLTTLEQRARRVIRGETDSERQSEVVQSRDEIGMLARAFNNMTSNLLNNKSELEHKVAELKNTNDALHQKSHELSLSEQRFKKIAEIMPDLVWMLQENGKADFFNKSWVEFCGQSEDGLKEFGWLNLLHPDDQKSVEETWEQCIIKKEDFEKEFRLKNSHGEYRWMLARGIPFTDENGNIENWLLAATDITGHKELISSKDEFISFTSHELRTPITGISAYVQLLDKCLKSREECDPQKYIDKLQMFVSRLNLLINELHDLTKAQAGKLQVKKNEFDFNEFINDVIESIESTTTSHRIIKTCEVDCKVKADRARLEQVLSNYLNNAIKYSPGQDEIRVFVTRQDHEIKVEVCDKGIGVPAEKKRAMFSKFFRADNTRNIEGLGLGLYISREIIKAHNGKVGVESEEGKGAKFYFTLPV